MLEFEWFDFRLSDECRDSLRNEHGEFLRPARSNEEFQRKIGSFKSSMLEFEWFDFRLSDECRDSLRNEHSEFLMPARSNEENIGMYYMSFEKRKECEQWNILVE